MCLLRMREAALEMIDRSRQAGVPIVVSGSDATDHPEIYLRRGAAAVILGEGEITLADLVDRMLIAAPIDDVPGIAFLDDTCAVRRTASRPFIKSLDELPFPAWDLVDTGSVSTDLAGAPRLLLDEPRDHPRLSVSLQLVRETDLRPALCDAKPEGGGR